MKKIISTLLCIAISSSTLLAFAANEETITFETADEASEVVLIDEPAQDSNDVILIDEPEQVSSEVVLIEEQPAFDPSVATSKYVSVTATISKPPYMKESDATVELLSMDGQVLGTKTVHITPDTDNVVFGFDVPEYAIGTSFKIRPVDGMHCIVYYTTKYYTGSEIPFTTYEYTDSNGNVAYSTDIAVTINPLFDKIVNVYYEGERVPIWGARVINGTAMVPVGSLAKHIGYNENFDSNYNTQVISIGNNYMFFNVGTAYTTIFGNDLYAPEPTVMIKDVAFAALRTFADAIGSTLSVEDKGSSLNVYMSKDTYLENYRKTIPVNRDGISSRTNYLVWVSLSEYKTRLYKGSQYNWEPILEATCAIGAPSTPTVTGSYEFKYTDRWDYGSYYVGPCLVFYRGYALHSVLLNQDGTEYDGRVGIKLSHGCIRLKKKDIDFIAKTIPVGTRIYITP